MRVKISYTAEIDEVLSESAYLINNLSGTINETIETFNQLVANLRADEFNSTEWYAQTQTLRKNLERLDTRVVEVEQIILGLEDYERGRHTQSPGAQSPEELLVDLKEGPEPLEEVDD